MTLPMLAADATLPEVATWMEEVGAALAPGDGFRHFNAMYLLVTHRVVERVAAGACRDPAFVARLDVVFARRYQDALLGPDDGVARAWRPMRQLRWHPRITPLQFALAGMNAHINRDLVHAVGPLDDAVEIWSIRTARAQAWSNAQIARALAGTFVCDEHLTAIDRTTAMVGRLLLVPMP